MKTISASVAVGTMLLTAWSGSVLPAAADQTAAPVTYSELAVGARPESVARGFGGKFFVSLQGANNTATVPDGEIKMVDGSAVTTFATGLYEPKGIAFTGQYLIVADLARVWRIDAQGNKVAIVDNDTANPKPFYNDVTLTPEGNAALVVEMGSRGVIRDPSTTPPVLWPLGSPQAAAIPVTARVFRVAVDGNYQSVIGPTADILIPNGVTTAPHGNEVFVTDFFNGRIVRVNPQGRTHIVADDPSYRGADGLALDDQHRMYVSSFESGQLFQVNPSGKKSRLLVDFGRNGAADLMYDAQTDSILFASTAHGTIVTIPLH